MKRIITYSSIVALGAIGGYAYYYFIGCISANSCPITSNPLTSTGYGALLGAVVGLNFTSFKRKSKDSQDK
jgi:hypothetical protein